jgi:hypothetical protein
MVDQMDISAELVRRGVSQEAADRLKGEIDGNDLMNLVNALNRNDRPARGQIEAEKILGKYGIKLGRNNMGDNYLGAKYESVRSGQALDETFGVMTKLNEGFSYAVEVSEQTRDRVLDWLDENQVEYQATSPMAYRIECGDRDVAYRTGRALSEILRKPTVRDSVEIEEKMSKNSKKREREAREKIADMKPRNPMVAAVKVRSGAGYHDNGKDPRKQDKFGRGAKHKPRFDEEIDFAIGEDVMVGDIAGQVKIPRGPNGTIGVIMNGQLEMVSETEVSHLNEGVMGMQPVNPLFRLRELAGLPRNMAEDDFEGIEVADAPEIDPEGVLAAGPVGGEEVPADMDIDGMGADPVEEPMADMDGGMDAPADDMALPGDDAMDIPADAGVPGALGTDPVEPVPGMAPAAPTQSEAMAQIEDSLNGIQSMLADIRLSEYKSLIQKLQDLTNQAQMMGRDYLGEQRRLKK